MIIPYFYSPIFHLSHSISVLPSALALSFFSHTSRHCLIDINIFCQHWCENHYLSSSGEEWSPLWRYSEKFDSCDNLNIAAKHQEPVEVLSQLDDTSTPQFMGSKHVASVVASDVICDRSLFPLEIAVSTELLTSCKSEAHPACQSTAYPAGQSEVYPICQSGAPPPLLPKCSLPPAKVQPTPPAKVQPTPFAKEQPIQPANAQHNLYEQRKSLQSSLSTKVQPTCPIKEQPPVEEQQPLHTTPTPHPDMEQSTHLSESSPPNLPKCSLSPPAKVQPTPLDKARDIHPPPPHPTCESAGNTTNIM